MITVVGMGGEYLLGSDNRGSGLGLASGQLVTSDYAPRTMGKRLRDPSRAQLHCTGRNTRNTSVTSVTLVTLITLVTLVTLVTQVMLATLVTLVTLATLVTQVTLATLVAQEQHW